MSALSLAFLLIAIAAGVSSQLPVGVPDKPTILPSSPSPYFVQATNRIDFYITCKTQTEQNQLVYAFFKDGMFLGKQGYSVFLIEYGQRKSGTYTCYVKNSAGTSEFSEGIAIIFVDSPKVIVSNEHPEIGDALNLFCSTPLETEDFQFLWYKDDLAMPQNGTQVYTIANASSAEVGEYQCTLTVKNNTTNYKFESEKSEKVYIAYTVPDQPTLKMNGIWVHDSTMEFICRGKDGSHIGADWAYLYFDDTKIAQVKAKDRLVTFTKQQLLFRDTGRYGCSLSNNRGESIRSPAIFIEVKARTPIERNIMTVDPINTKGRMGTVMCRLPRSDGTSTFSIDFCTMYINEDRYLDDTDCLFEVLPNVTALYSCSGSSINGSSPIGPENYVIFVDEIKITPVNKKPPVVNQIYSLQCMISSEGVNVSWYTASNFQFPIASNTNIFSFNPLRAIDDSSSYVCKAISSDGYEIWSIAYILLIEPPPAPSLEVNQESKVIHSAGNYYSCYYLDAEIYNLYKEGVKVSTQMNGNGRFLIFNSPTSGGYYTCTYTKSFVESEHSYPIYVQARDEVTLIASKATAIVGQPLNLTCSANDTDPNITYKWTIYSQQTEREVRQQTLIFDPVTQTDEGVYSCDVDNDGNTSVSMNYYVIAFAPPLKPSISYSRNSLPLNSPLPYDWNFSNNSQSKNVFDLCCECSGISCDPRYSLRLYKNGIWQNIPFREEVSFWEGFSIKRYYDLDVSGSDVEGNYSCTAINSFNESEYSNVVIVPAKEEYPRPTIDADSTFVEIGMDIELTCNVPGLPDYRIQWAKNYGVDFRTGRNLALLLLDSEDSGQYTCFYVNNNYQEIHSDIFLLVLNEPLQPQLVLKIDDEENPARNRYDSGAVFFTIAVGDIVRMRCISQNIVYSPEVVSSNIIANETMYTLYNDGIEVTTVMTREDFEVSGLAIGTYNYTCMASNTIADSWVSYPLVVHVVVKPKIIASSTSPAINSILTLICSTGQPSDSGEIIWKKNGQTLPQTSNELILIGLSLYDEGRYTCRHKIGPWYHPNSDDYLLTFATRDTTPDIFTLHGNTLQAGSHLWLYCLSTNTLSYKAVFYRNGVTLATVNTKVIGSAGQVMYTYSSAFITSSGSGNFTCTIEDTLGVSQNSNYVAITFAAAVPAAVSDKPTIRLPSGLPYFKASEIYSMQCMTNLMGGQLIYKFYKYEMLVLTFEWNNYVFLYPNKDQTGIYTCTVSSPVGESEQSDGVYLTFVDVPKLTANTEDPQVGNALILTCNISLPTPEFQFNWFKGKNIITGKNEQVFKIEKVAASDEGDYSCLITIKKTEGTSVYSFSSDKSSTFSIVVSVPAKPTLASYGNGIQGQILSLYCEVNTTSPSAGLEWSYLYFNGARIAQTFPATDVSIFNQGQALFRDDGTYECLYSNRRGESALSPAIHVLVEKWGSVSSLLNNAKQVMIRGKNDYIPCWPDRYRMKAFYCTLYINGERYVEDQDCSFQVPHSITGSYACSLEIFNQTGPPGLPVNITFIDAPRIRPLTQGLPVPNQNYSLQCVTDLNGTAVYWYENDSTLPVASNVDILNLNLSGMTDGYRYRCKLSISGAEFWSNYYMLNFQPPAAPTLSGGITGPTQMGSLQYSSSLQFNCSGKDAEFYTLYKDGVCVLTVTQSNFLVFSSGKSGASYTCTANNKAAESEHSRPVYVPGKDAVILSASTFTAKLGQNLTLTCAVQNITQANITYKWTIYRPDITKTGTFPEQVRGQNLTFRPVTLNDTGLYTCEAGFNGQTLMANNYYTINTAPPMTPEINDMKIGPPDVQFFPDTLPSSIYYRFTCTCRGISCDPRNQFRLYKNGVKIKNVLFGEKLSFSMELVIMRYYIIDISVPDNVGNYTCTAINSMGESQHSTTVSVSATDVFPVPRISVNNPNATLGQDITFMCEVPPRIPDSNVLWSKNNDEFMRTGRTFTLLSLAREDDGRYSCLYTNCTSFYNYNFIEIRSANIYIILREPLQPSLVLGVSDEENPFRLNQDSGVVFFMFGDGDTILLRCISQQPAYNYFSQISENVNKFTLYKDGQEVAKSEAKGEFEVSGLAIGHYNYTCKASNQIGDSLYSYPLPVNVVARPTINASSDSPTLGGSLTLICKTEKASDGSDIIWKRNGKILPQNLPELILVGLSQYDEGKYSCRQKIESWYYPNSDDYFLAFGTMAATPDIFTTISTTVEIGSPLKLFCLSTSTTSYLAVFYRNGSPVSTVYKADQDNADQVLYSYSVQYATSEDSGNYTCTVENSQGTSLKSDILIVNFLGVGTCTPNSCPVNEMCVSSDSAFECYCPQGFSRSNNGICEECHDSFQGPDCGGMACNCNPHNSICNRINGTCHCLAGWEGTTCDTDIDECQKNTHNCTNYNSTATCRNTQGSYECVCSNGNRNNDSKTCAGEFQHTFEIRFPYFSPSDSMLVKGSEKYTALVAEIQDSVRPQLQKLVKGFRSYVVMHLRRGSLIVEGEVTIDKDINRNAGGEFIMALTKLHISTVNGTQQNETVITVADTVVTSDMNQCEVRQKINLCSNGTTCVMNNESVSECRTSANGDSTDMYIGIGIGVGLAVLLIVGVAVVIFIKCHKKTKYIGHNYHER